MTIKSHLQIAFIDTQVINLLKVEKIHIIQKYKIYAEIKVSLK